MNKILSSALLFSVLTLTLGALTHNNHYSAPSHHRNSLGPQSSYRGPAYGSNHPVAPPPQYAGGRRYGNAAPSYNAPAHYSASSHAAPASSHYGGFNRRSSAPAYPSHQEQPRPAYPSHQEQSRPAYPSHQEQPRPYGPAHRQESQPQTHGREMKYTIRDPNNRGTTHVTETHVVSNRQMHGAEAEAAMKKLMGSMGPASYGSDSNFQNFVKDMGLPFY